MAGHHSVHSHATEDGEVSSSESESYQDEGDGTEEDNAEEDKGRIETSSDRQEVSNGEAQQEHPHTQDTLTSISQLFGQHEDTDQESDPGEKSHQHGQSGTQTAPKRTAPANHCLPRRSHQQRHSVMGVGRKCSCWTHTLMPGITTKFPTASQAG